jgi:hypothetical protein
VAFQRPSAARVALVVAVFVIGFGIFAAEASAGGVHGVLSAKKAKGPYQTETARSISEGQTRVVYWRVINPEGAPQEMTLDDQNTTIDSDYKFKWYEGAKPKPSKNITDEVADTGAGFDFTLPAGYTKTFSTEIKAKDATNSRCLVARVSSDTTGFIDTAFVGINGLCV